VDAAQTQTCGVKDLKNLSLFSPRIDNMIK